MSCTGTPELLICSPEFLLLSACWSACPTSAAGSSAQRGPWDQLPCPWDLSLGICHPADLELVGMLADTVTCDACGL